MGDAFERTDGNDGAQLVPVEMVPTNSGAMQLHDHRTIEDLLVKVLPLEYAKEYTRTYSNQEKLAVLTRVLFALSGIDYRRRENLREPLLQALRAHSVNVATFSGTEDDVRVLGGLSDDASSVHYTLRVRNRPFFARLDLLLTAETRIRGATDARLVDLARAISDYLTPYLPKENNNGERS